MVGVGSAADAIDCICTANHAAENWIEKLRGKSSGRRRTGVRLSDQCGRFFIRSGKTRGTPEGKRSMKTLIHGGWVVGFHEGTHQVFEDGAVVFEGDRIVHAGAAYAGPVDRRIDARGHLVSPGFINTHIHPAGNGGDYLLLDSTKNDYRSANYLAFAAPLKGKAHAPPPEAVAALRSFVFLHAMKHGATTILDV